MPTGCNKLNYVEFLRDVGRHFSVNRMLSLRLASSCGSTASSRCSFLEFNYMILQAYDFVELNRRYGCVLQMGGSDQWGNIINGIDLGRRMGDAQLYALTTPLLTTSSGAKMGKTASGAVWLNADLLQPLRLLAVLAQHRGRRRRRASSSSSPPAARRDRPARGAAAPRSTRPRRCWRPKRPRSCTAARRPTRRPRPRAGPSRKARSRKTCRPSRSPRAELDAGLGVLAAFVQAGLAASNGEARRQIKGGGLRVNDETVTDEKMVLTPRDADARRRDQAVARQEAARAAEAGLDRVQRDRSARRSARSWSRRRSRNSKNLRSRPGAIAEIGLTIGRGLPVGPLTS